MLTATTLRTSLILLICLFTNIISCETSIGTTTTSEGIDTTSSSTSQTTTTTVAPTSATSTSTPQTTTPKDCTVNTPTIGNGHISLDTNNSTTVGSKANVTCDPGYDANTSYISCQENGNWSTAQCEPKDCTAKTPTIDNGYISLDTNRSTTFESKANVTCVPGYDANTSTIICQENGNWSTAQCDLKDCTAKTPTIDNGKISLDTNNSTTFRSNANVTCDPGYHANTSTISCKADGNWSTAQCDLKEIGYNGTCDNDGPDEQCNITTNAKCINGACICEDTTHQYVDNDRGCVERPALPTGFNVTFEPNPDNNRTSLNVSWGIISSVYLTILPPTEDNNSSFNANSSPKIITNLHSGTKYTVCVYTNSDGVHSYNCSSKSSYTVPEPVPKLSVPKINENEIEVYWNSSKNCEKYNVTLSSSGKVKRNVIVTRGSSTSFNTSFTNLTAATQYTVLITAIAGQYSSTDNNQTIIYTRPPIVASIASESSTESLNLTMDYTGANEGKVKYCIYLPPTASLKNGTEDEEFTCDGPAPSNKSATLTCTPSNQVTIIGLKSATPYTFQVYTCLATEGSEVLASEHLYNISVNTRPENNINLNVIEWEEQSLNVNWSTGGRDVNVSLKIEPGGDEPKIFTDTTGTYRFENLSPGKQYNISAYSVVGGKYSENAFLYETYTKPSSTNITHVEKFENSLNLTVDRKVFFNKLRIIINGKDTREYDDMGIDGVVSVRNLTAGTRYHITVVTIIRTNGHDLESSVKANKSSFTLPAPPTRVEFPLHHIHEDSFTVNITGGPAVGAHDGYCAILTAGTEKHSCTNTSVITFRNLQPGTLYNMSIYSRWSGENGTTPLKASIYTRPAKVTTLEVNSTTNNSITVHWTRPEGMVHNYNVTFTCTSPNNKTIRHDTNTSAVESRTISKLDPGTRCNVTIQTHIDSLSGEKVNFQLNTTSDESAPSAVRFIDAGNNNTNTTLTVGWNIPTVPNGIVRKYRISAIDMFENCTKATFVYSNCENETLCEENGTMYCENRHVNEPQRCENHKADNQTTNLQLYHQFTHLHPYRNYSISVQVFTRCWGPAETIHLSTDTAVPSSAPKATVTVINATSIAINWEKMGISESNGIISDFKIKYTFENRSCFNSTSTIGSGFASDIDSSATSYILENLRPFTYYNISISASTSGGRGPYSECTEETCLQRTNETFPGDVRSVSDPVSGQTNIEMSWEPPCRPNGVIIGYTMHITDRDTGEQWTNKTDSNSTSYVIENLLPYRNYTIAIAASTIVGEGPNTNKVNATTKIAKPTTPNTPTVNATSSKKLKVKWAAVSQNQYTGPTTYLVEAIDNVTNKLTSTCNTNGFNSTECTIKDLDQYWQYKVSVTAFTDAGNETSAYVVNRTSEDTPGPVTSVHLYPEENVTEVRSISVSWGPPTDRDKNGILRRYHVNCTLSDGSVSFKNSTEVNVGTTNVTFMNIPPGTYQVSVYAATIIGLGSESKRETTLEAGAPLKVIESSEHPLMQAASQPANDDETLITIMLPIRQFLCNDSNGKPKHWGVIVAEENKAIDIPFNGKKADFDKMVEQKYKTWADVKNSDSFSPYIATSENWTLCRTRKRRSIMQDQTFTVGEQGECSERCNGKLKPGHTYRVKSFVCTDTGCTETLYSQPISTATATTEAPDLTAAIAACVSSAFVVIAVVAVVVFVLRRRRAVCFSKEVEDVTTHTTGNDIALDNVVPKKKNSFRPGQMKLADFPNTVEQMHRDTDLLFADAYKLIKEKSPQFPMTAAEQQCCRPKNRYTNILPFDQSRVKLRPSDDVEGSDYINANYIPGYHSRREYIATQGPMPATFDDFWRMVWEQNVDTIVMLTKLMEKGRNKCDKYWPDLSEPVFYGDLVVTLQSESNLSDYTIKIFEVKLKSERKMVRHFSYLKWPDMGCPETPQLLLDFVKAVRQYTDREKKQGGGGPTIVHCSAGVGRTGTFIAVDHLLQHIRDHDEVDIYSLVLEMRQHRLNMVQTEDQYVYIHECLKAFIMTDEDDEEDDEEPLYMNTAIEEENVYENTAFKMD